MSERQPVAIVTGASRGLGLALARRLAADRWRLVLDARGAPALESVRAELAGTTDVRAIAGDVADDSHRAELVAAAAQLGDLTLLVNNASVLGPSPQPRLADYSVDDYAHVLYVNTVAPLALAQRALPALRAAHGTIVNITLRRGDRALRRLGWIRLVEGGARAAGQRSRRGRADVHVYTFDPGDMRTQMHQEAFPGEDISDRPEPETVVPAFAHLLRSTPPSGRYRAADFEMVTP